MLDLLDKGFKLAILNMFKELKEIMSKRTKGNYGKNVQIEMINKEIEII